MKKTNLVLAASMLCVSYNVNALGVDSLIKIMDNKQDVISISNNDGFRQFVNVNVAEINVENGDLVATPYNKENLASWTLELRPNKMILDNGQMKKVAIKYTGEEQQDQDKIYSLNISPTPYYSEEDAPANTVQMVIGVAPYVIMPAKNDSPLSYKVEHKGDHVFVHNTGKTYFRALLKVCDSISLKVPANQCATDAYVLSGRKMKIMMPDRVKNSVNLTFRTHSGQYKDSFSMKNGQSKTK